jgi:3-oxoadipate enol-lactonase
MPNIKVDDGCVIRAEVEGPERTSVLMPSNSFGTNLHMWDEQVGPFTRHFRMVRADTALSFLLGK